MDAKTLVNEQLNIPLDYLKNISKADRVEGIVHRTWISELVEQRRVPLRFVPHEQLSADEVTAWLTQGENFSPPWERVLFTVVKKQDCPVIPLPRAKPRTKSETPLSYCQTLHYVSHTNHKNLWKEAFKKYSGGSPAEHLGRQQDHATVQLTESASVLRDVLERAYGCPVIPLDDLPRDTTQSVHEEQESVHPNLLPCRVALETSQFFILVHDRVPEHTLLDCVTFSPAALASHTKPLFIIYQLLCLLRHVHDLGLVLGNVSLSDIYVDPHLWIQVIPRWEANIYQPQRKSRVNDVSAADTDDRKDIHALTLAWVRGATSTLDYLTALNVLAGRKFVHKFPYHSKITIFRFML